MESNEFDDVSDRCPYCARTEYCEHVLLIMDRTSLEAEGGLLMKVFNARWRVLCEDGGDDFPEAEAFSGLIDEVEGLSDCSIDQTIEGAPGMSFGQTTFYVSSAERGHDALIRFALSQS